MIHFHCLSCDCSLSVSDDYPHRRARCGRCKQITAIKPVPPPLNRTSQPSPNFGVRKWLPIGALSLLAGIALLSQIFYSSPTSGVRKDIPVAPIVAVNDIVIPTHPIEPEMADEQQNVPPPVETDRPEAVQSLTFQVANATTNENPPIVQEEPDVAVIEVKSDIDKAPPANHIAQHDSSEKRTRQQKLDHESQIANGQLLFSHIWKPNDRLSRGGDGLGPYFNGRSCVECHFQAGSGGSGTNGHNVQMYEVLPNRQGGESRDGVIHTFSTGAAEETASLLRTKLGDPMIPAIHLQSRAPTMIDAVRTVFVNTPALWGDGLIDQITDQDLLNLEKRPETTGRLRYLDDGRIGKFGWKSQMASLHDFVAGACAGELGLTNRFKAQQILFQEDQSAAYDMNLTQVNSLIKYVGSLPAPEQALPRTPAAQQQIATGHRVFSRIGCANCHVENVGRAKGVFSDFRLHLIANTQVKEDKYYSPEYKPIYQPKPSYPKLAEWKTPPLWGVASTAPYWHDGSAPTLQDAILKHEQDAQSVTNAYRTLVKEDQLALIAFLKSLKAPAADQQGLGEKVASMR